MRVWVRSCRSLRSVPELCAVRPHAVQDDSKFSGDGDDGASPALGLHQPHAPGFEARPGDRAHEHGVGGRVEGGAHVGVAGVGDAAGIVLLAGLEASGRQAEVGADGARAPEAGGIVDSGLEAQGGDLTDARDAP